MSVFWLKIAILLCCLAANAAAQYRVDYWTTRDGLPQNSVFSIVQTRDGYLWFTTFDGLVRFDGVRFTIFDRGNTPGITSNRFTYLFEAAEGALWIGTEYGGVLRYRDGEFRRMTDDADSPYYSVILIQESPAGEIVVTTNRGIIRIGAETKRELSEREVVQPVIFYGKSGAVWTFEADGLHETRGEKNFSYPIYNSSNKRSRVCEDADGALWLATGATFYQFKNGTTIEYSAGNPGKAVTREIRFDELNQVIYQDQTGNFWTSNENGLLIFNPQTGERTRIGAQEGLPDEIVQTVTSDREGNVWVGLNNRGIARLTRRFITTISSREKINGDIIYPLFEDAAGDVWVGATNVTRIRGGAAVTNFDWGEKIAYGANLPHSFAADRAGRLWVGFLSGVGYWQNERFTDLSDKIGRETFTVIHEDREGALWLGSNNGLTKFKDNEKTVFTVNEGLPSNEIKDIYEDRAGRLWLATYGGLARFDDGKFIVFDERSGLSSNRVRTITGDAEDNETLWLGTYDGGLSRFRNGEFVNFTQADGLFNNGVFRILDDGRGFFWMSSNRGIHRVAKQQLADFAAGRINRLTSTGYGIEDGMLSSECNGGRQPAGFRARDGRLWFPTQQGAVIINPEAAPFNSQPPPVVIETVKIDNQESKDFQSAIRNPQSEIVLQPGQANLEINYTGLSLLKSSQIRFRYKLENLDRDWIDAGTRRAAYFSYLPPGDYVFRVTAANADGVWNETGKQFRLRVVAPFYRTVWFYAVCACGAFALVFAGFRLRLNKIRRTQREQAVFSRRLIASQEQERKRIAGELHDELGQLLLIIKNRAFLGLKAVETDDGEAKSVRVSREQFGEIYDSASEAIHQTRQIAHALRPLHLERLGLTAALEEMLDKVAASSGILFDVEIIELYDFLSLDEQINLYRIVQETVNNIVRHSSATRASVSVTRNDARLEIKIADNGKGFDQFAANENNSRSAGLGLTSIAERARILGADYSLESTPGVGTSVFINLEVKKELE